MGRYLLFFPDVLYLIISYSLIYLKFILYIFIVDVFFKNNNEYYIMPGILIQLNLI